MKREALRHPKTYDLAARLGCSRPEAIGFLDLLWDFCADVALAGNIGRWPDGAIARACDWTGDPTAFVDALVASGWLDRDEEHRLLAHGWSEHCQQWVRQKATKLGVSLLGGSEDDISTVSSAVRSTVATAVPTAVPTAVRSTVDAASRDRTEPNRTHTIPGPGPGDEPEPEPDENEFDPDDPVLSQASATIIDAMPAGKLSRSVFAPLTEVHLKSTATMVEWHAKQLSATHPVVGNTEAHLLLVLAAALHATEMHASKVEKSRVAVFVGIVRRKAWNRVTRWVPRAKEKLEEFRARLQEAV